MRTRLFAAGGALLAAMAAGIAATSAPAAHRDDAAAEKLGWRLCLQAYTLRSMTFYEVIDQAAALGLKCIEMYPGQTLSRDNKVKADHNMPPEVRQEVRKKLQEAGLKLVCYGVVSLGNNEAAHRKVFDFAKEMGIENIVTETTPTELLDRLCGEYGVNMALHNHPKSWPPDQVLKACEGRSKRVGACADTGHWMRAGLNPVETLKKLQGRIICLHFKDLDAGHDVPWGAGKCDARAMLAELKRQGFKGAISMEYEYGNGAELLGNLAKCVEFFDRTAAELAREPSAPGG